ncbi:MAG: penicillin-binding protein 2 [Alphaproteobacteria bacterium]|jgi:cell division protein FtsI (penicillin-binding protein 3)|nr:penicillin-binding protein 2 [Alphaproteobacteria bacterium]
MTTYDPARDAAADLCADPRPVGRRTVRLTGGAAQALEVGRMRLMITGMVMALAFVAVGYRSVEVAVFRAGNEPALAAVTAAPPPVGRADIVDRNGVLLATSLPVSSLYADPTLVLDPEEAADAILGVLPDLDRERLIERLTARGRFSYIRRGLTPEQEYRLNALGVPGLDFEPGDRRFYPTGRLMAHVVGYTGIDGQGLAGAELSMERRLTSDSTPVRLSVDVRLQQVMRDELARSMAEFRAVGAAGVVMDVDTGEVLAMVSLPDFDPYEIEDEQAPGLFNRATLGVYEMGSTFKVFNTAMALDLGVTTLDGGYDATHPIQAYGFTIRDYHPERRWLSVPEILLHSSNIASVHMALDAGTPAQRTYLERFGLTRRSPIELQDVGAPMIPDPWREINTMTIAYGHGMAVSAMQVVSGVAAAVNGGMLYPATLLARPQGVVEGSRAISEATSDQMRRLMRLVVNEGTGRNGSAEGYVVGGKTGTAEKAVPAGYDGDSRLSSFVAAFPMTDPQYVVFAMLDEPKGNESTYNFATAGWTAAPVVRRVIERMGPLYGLSPVDEEAPAVREALAIDAAAPGSRLASFQN